MAQRLTDRVVKGLPRPKAGNRIYYDDLVSGFGCRVTAGGARAFVLNYRRRTDGLERRFTIGSFPDWSVAGAREEAKGLRRAVDGGADPVGDHRAEREAPTVNDLCDRYENEQLPRRRASTQRDYRSMLGVHIRPWLGKRKVSTLAYSDVDFLHREITRHSGPYRANRVIALLSKLCSLAVQWHWRADNPCKGVERNDEAKRKRYLSGAELERLSAALAQHDDRDAADIFRLLLLSGARRGEVLSARWQDLDLETGVWTKPGATTKQRTEHIVPLSAPARQLLAGRPRGDSEYVFPGRNIAVTVSKSNPIGAASANPPRSPACALTTCAIPTHRSSPAPASDCTPSEPCLATPSRRPRTDTPTFSTITCARRRSVSAK
jgi:Arm DNA-binding domain/Phage integrase family